MREVSQRAWNKCSLIWSTKQATLISSEIVHCLDQVYLPGCFSGKWCLGAKFDALQRSHLCPDFQSNQYLSRISEKAKRPILANSQGPWTVGQGPGLLRAIFHQIWTFLKGVGHRMAGLRSYNAGLIDWLADLIFDNFARKQPCSCYCLPSSLLQRLITFFLFFKTCANDQRNLTKGA